MHRGKAYSPLNIQAIEDAPPFFIGVKLAKICVKLDIPVRDVAKYLGVSRQLVSSWFYGKQEVSPQYEEQIEKLIAKLT